MRRRVFVQKVTLVAAGAALIPGMMPASNVSMNAIGLTAVDQHVRHGLLSAFIQGQEPRVVIGGWIANLDRNVFFRNGRDSSIEDTTLVSFTLGESGEEVLVQVLYSGEQITVMSDGETRTFTAASGQREVVAHHKNSSVSLCDVNGLENITTVTGEHFVVLLEGNVCVNERSLLSNEGLHVAGHARLQLSTATSGRCLLVSRS